MADVLTRADLLALKPGAYLQGGFVDGTGALRPELRGLTPFAVATQLEQGEVSPQEVAFTLEALRQVLPSHTGTAGERLKGAVRQALDLVAGMLGIFNNAALETWLSQCVPFVKTDQDLAA